MFHCETSHYSATAVFAHFSSLSLLFRFRKKYETKNSCHNFWQLGTTSELHTTFSQTGFSERNKLSNKRVGCGTRVQTYPRSTAHDLQPQNVPLHNIHSISWVLLTEYFGNLTAYPTSRRMCVAHKLNHFPSAHSPRICRFVTLLQHVQLNISDILFLIQYFFDF